MQQGYLTTSKKDQLTPIILNRDGPECFFCKKTFDDSLKLLRRTFDHLDNNARNNELLNLVLCHFKCNQDKKWNIDYQLMAQDKIRSNSISFDTMRARGNTTHEPKQTSKEIDINVAFYKITKDYISDRLINQGLPAMLYKDTAYSVFYIMKEQTGHGSSTTAERYINGLCSTAGPFFLEEEGGLWFIKKKLVK